MTRGETDISPHSNPLSRLPPPLAQPWFNPWALEFPDKMRDYRNAQRWWGFCTVWRVIGTVHAIKIGWYRKWPHLTMPKPPVPAWRMPPGWWRTFGSLNGAFGLEGT